MADTRRLRLGVMVSRTKHRRVNLNRHLVILGSWLAER
jgi:hypothetical protein